MILTRKFETLIKEFRIENSYGNKDYDKIETFYDENDNENYNHMNYESSKAEVNSSKSCQDIGSKIHGEENTSSNNELILSLKASNCKRSKRWTLVSS